MFRSIIYLGGGRIYSAASVTAAEDEIIGLSLTGLLLNDPAYTQALIAGLGGSPGVNDQVMRQLAVHPHRLFEYQLLGMQMQLAHLLV